MFKTYLSFRLQRLIKILLIHLKNDEKNYKLFFRVYGRIMPNVFNFSKKKKMKKLRNSFLSIKKTALVETIAWLPICLSKGIAPFGIFEWQKSVGENISIFLINLSILKMFNIGQQAGSLWPVDAIKFI